ncbi:MAG: ATP-binding protein, partial [Bacteroidota bacterium]
MQKKINKPSIYLDLEDPGDLVKLNEATLFLAPYTEHTVILDEVQKAPHLFPLLRGIIDADRKPGRFVLLGSASPALIRDSSETLAGRIAYYELPPFSWAEVESRGDWRVHWVRGGFPESFLAPSLQLSAIWRRQFIRTYLERDLPLLGLNAAPLLTERLWSMCAHQTGQVLNLDKLGASLGISGATVRRYLDFFEAAYLIRRLPPYHANLKKRLVKSPKLFVRDTGILHQLLGISSFLELSGHPMLGASWEAYVVEQIASVLPSWGKLYF